MDGGSVLGNEVPRRGKRWSIPRGGWGECGPVEATASRVLTGEDMLEPPSRRV